MGSESPSGRAGVLQVLEGLFAHPQTDPFGQFLPPQYELRSGEWWEVRRGVIGYSADPWIQRLRGVDMVVRRTLHGDPPARQYEADFNLAETPHLAPVHRYIYAPEGDSIVTDLGEVTRPGPATYNVVRRALGAVILVPELSVTDPRAEAA